MAALGERLQEYYRAIERESLKVQAGECDFLIESTSDSLLRQFVALDIYRHYLDSPVMGAENVAVYVYDKWFDSGEVKMKSEADRIAAKVYAEFNRQSLIGKKAPTILLESFDGTPVDVYGAEDMSRRYRIMYFYDTDCSKCRLETILLKNLMAVKSYPVDLYAIYVGSDREAWAKYISGSLTVQSARHFWDPGLESDFQRKYGVLQTPRLFLIAPDGVIIGRGLDVRALETMLESIFSERKLEYGGPESEALFDGIFAASQGRPTVGEVKGIADYITDRTIARGDTLMFRQMAGDYLYYLASRSGEGFKEGLKYHIDKNISDQNSVWRSGDDSLKVVGFAQIMSDLLSKAVPGSKIPAIKVPGELYTLNKQKAVKVRLDKVGKKLNTIIFFTEGCEVCASEKKIALEGINDKSTAVLMINMDRIFTDNPSLATKLMDSFDLSSLPFIIQTDSSGTILRRYILES
jgi:hypothetical protein